MTFRYGLTIPLDGVPLSEHKEWFHRIADLGYTDVWSAEVDGTDGFTPLALAAAWEPRLNLGVAVTPRLHPWGRPDGHEHREHGRSGTRSLHHGHGCFE